MSMNKAPQRVIGIDIGAQKTMMVADDGEIVLTDTGSVSRPTLVTFSGKKRLFGEEAQAQSLGNNSSVNMLNLLVGRSPQQLQALTALAPAITGCGKFSLQLPTAQIGEIGQIDPSSVTKYSSIGVTYGGEQENFPPSAVLAMYVSYLWKRILAVYGKEEEEEEAGGMRVDDSVLPSLIFSLIVPSSTSPCAAATGGNSSGEVEQRSAQLRRIECENAIRDACVIAGVPSQLRDGRPLVSIVESADCLVAAYEKKLQAITDADLNALMGKNVVIIEMGHTHTSVVRVCVQDASAAEDAPKSGAKRRVCAQKLAVQQDENLGAYFFDLALFQHFAQICESKGGEKLVQTSKRGARLFAGCERMKKLLSQLPESRITVENLTDAGDMDFSISRDTFAQLSSDLLASFKKLVLDSLQGVDMSSVAAVELVGGGVRMAIVQSVVREIFGAHMPLGAKLDDTSVARGAALLAKKQQQQQILSSELPTHTPLSASATDGTASPLTPTPPPPTPSSPSPAAVEEAISSDEIPQIPSVFTSNASKLGDVSTATTAPPGSCALSAGLLSKYRERELAMSAQDAEIDAYLAARNQLEAYLLEMRGAPGRKHGEKIDASALNKVLDEYEEWLWDHTVEGAEQQATLSDVNEKYNDLRVILEGNGQENDGESKNDGLCGAYLSAMREEQRAMELALEREEAAAAAQREAEGGAGGGEEQEDHDFRKLKKADRMRLVTKNKEEGTELFKGGNIRPAAARYQKALTHCAKFFDLSAEDEKEISAIKLSLYLNLASCYIKLAVWEQVLRNCEEALIIEPRCSKALFRRATYWETHKKDWQRALEDLKACQSILGETEDKMVTKAMERVKKEITKEKNKEKKMWGKAFA